MGIKGLLLTYNFLNKIYTDSNSEISFEKGVKTGRQYAENLFKSLGVKAREILNAYLKMTIFKERGAISIATFDKKKKVVIVKYRNPRPENREFNAFVRGITQGVFEHAFEGEIELQESKCTLRGDEFCEFIISKLDDFSPEGPKFNTFNLSIPEVHASHSKVEQVIEN
ncbi:MAG: 4-vinyl reductase [Euryarchaeota archaeon]|nr:4-vinyl reductase [Euryarchaeota archaeon]